MSFDFDFNTTKKRIIENRACCQMKATCSDLNLVSI